MATAHSPAPPLPSIPSTSSDPVADADTHATSADFSTALSIWRDLNLAELKATLAQTAPPLLEAQKTALINRKQLAEQTREFKKQPDDAKLDAIKPLLKAYQAEIDTLTKRSKTAENAFLNVHSALASAPDPYPFLEIVLEQAASLNDLDSTKQENTALRREIQRLRDGESQRQADHSDNQRLQQCVHELEASFEERLAQRIDAVEKEVSAKWDERLRNLQEREKDLTQSLHLAHQQLQELKSKDESATAQLLQQGQQVDERETRGKLAEMELLTRDLERAQSRVENVERRNEQLRAEIESIKSGRDENDRIDAMAKELMQKEARISQLQALIESERRQLQSNQHEAARAVEEKARLQRDREAEVESLRAKLARCADYDEIKRELEIVKMVEFSNEYGDDNDDDEERKGEVRGDSNGITAEAAEQEAPRGGSKAKPLEALLLEKNRKLQDQLTSLRVAHDELTSTSSTSSTELARLKKEVARLQSLNEKLENDLVSVGGGNGESASAAAATSAAAAPPRSAPAVGKDAVMSAEEALAEMERIASTPASTSLQTNGQAGAVPSSSAASTSPQPPASPMARSATAASHDTSILPIITSQRDRFRARNAELEEELRRQFATISELRNEIKTLQADNLTLYEKLRYLQTYNAAAAAGNGEASGSVQIGMGAASASMATYPPESKGRSSADEKYRARYEERMDPWERFRGGEQTRIVSSMTAPERMLHMLTKLVLGHRRMRILLILYAAGLHAMVFALLFEVGHTSSGATCALSPP
ncbi:hypothetical protein ACQY0O_002280 [Thecaphora frezii]